MGCASSKAVRFDISTLDYGSSTSEFVVDKFSGTCQQVHDPFCKYAASRRAMFQSNLNNFTKILLFEFLKLMCKVFGMLPGTVIVIIKHWAACNLVKTLLIDTFYIYIIFCCIYWISKKSGLITLFFTDVGGCYNIHSGPVSHTMLLLEDGRVVLDGKFARSVVYKQGVSTGVRTRNLIFTRNLQQNT